MAIASFILTELFALLFILNKAFWNPDYNIVFKIIASIFFIITPILAYKKKPCDKKYFYLILTGLVFSLFGDIFLGLKSSLCFNLGVTSFTIAQIFFLSAFTYLEKVNIIDFVIFLMLSVVLIIIQNCTDNFDYDGKYILILIYTLIISFMLSKALSLLRMIKGNEITVILIVISMILFFLSDFILLFVYFYKTKFNILPYFNTVFYYLAQGLLGLSFLKPIKKLDKQNKI